MSRHRERRRSHYDSLPEEDESSKMVLEKQDSGISLSTTDGMDYSSKMADVASTSVSLEHLYLVGNMDARNGCHFHSDHEDNFINDRDDSDDLCPLPHLHPHPHHRHGHTDPDHRDNGEGQPHHQGAGTANSNGVVWGPEDGIHFNNFRLMPRHGSQAETDHHNHDDHEDDADVHVPLHKTVCCSLCRKKQERLQKAAAAAAADSQGSLDSIPDTVSVTSSISSSRASRPWIKDPLADAKPITDPILRQKLPGASVGGRSRVSSRRSSYAGESSELGPGPLLRKADHKILQLMIQKREAEKKEKEERDRARAQWEEEKNRTTASRRTVDRQRRQSVGDGRVKQLAVRTRSHPLTDSGPSPRASPLPRSVSTPTPTPPTPRCASAATATSASTPRARDKTRCNHANNPDQPCGCGRDHNRQVERETRKKKEEATIRRQREEEVHQCERNHTTVSQRQLDLQKQRLQEKKKRDLERKLSVEKRLEEQKRELEEYNNSLKQRNQQGLKRAQSVKTLREHEIAERARLKNEEAMRRHEEKMNLIKRQSTEDLMAKKATLDLREHLSKGTKEDIMTKKERDAKRRSMELEQRLQKTRGNKERLDEEVQTWQEDLLRYRKTQEHRAAEQAKKNVILKKEKAKQDRLEKARLAKENLEKLQSQEDEWKASVEASLALKDAKTRMLLQEKEEIIHESRAMAETSQRLREELRTHYSMNDLDKLSQQANLEARFITKS